MTRASRPRNSSVETTIVVVVLQTQLEGGFNLVADARCRLVRVRTLEMPVRNDVRMLLGHSELRVTMDFDAHLQKQTAAKAARRMDTVLRESSR